MPTISRAALLLPSGEDIRIGSPVDGITMAGLAQGLNSLLASRVLGVSQAVVQIGDWRTVEGNGGTPSASVFRVLHQVGPCSTFARLAFWYTRSEEKPTGSEEVEVEWVEPDGTTVFATTTWGDDALDATPAGTVRAIDAGVVSTQGALVGREGYAEVPLDADGADPEPRLIDVSAYRGEVITLVFTLNAHRVLSVHVSDVAVEEV